MYGSDSKYGLGPFTLLLYQYKQCEVDTLNNTHLKLNFDILGENIDELKILAGFIAAEC